MTSVSDRGAADDNAAALSAPGVTADTDDSCVESGAGFVFLIPVLADAGRGGIRLECAGTLEAGDTVRGVDEAAGRAAGDAACAAGEDSTDRGCNTAVKSREGSSLAATIGASRHDKSRFGQTSSIVE